MKEPTVAMVFQERLFTDLEATTHIHVDGVPCRATVKGPRTILDPVRARAVTERGIAQADANAAEEWRAALRVALERVARRRPDLTSDDLWVEVGEDGMGKGNPSALGSIFRGAAKDGLIRLTDQRRESQRPAHHRKPLRVWASLVCPR
jgi:hypothetical protein